MTLRTVLIASSLALCSLASEAVRPVKTKAPTVAPEQLLREAEQAYRSYRFDEASTALGKYQAAIQRKKEGASDRAKLLGEQLARAERMYTRAEVLHVVDSALVGKRELFERLPQGSSRILSEAHTLVGDSLLLVAGYQDALRKNYLRPSPQGLQWLSSVGEAGTEQWEARPMNLASLGSEATLTSPFLLEDGTTLLFAKHADQGLGGYDLYMTRLTEQGNSFFEPTLLGMPYNSPANDYLLAYHESEGWGVLVSDRFAPQDSVHIYRFVGRPPFLATQAEAVEEEDLTDEQRFQRASLRGVLYTDSLQTAGKPSAHPSGAKGQGDELYFVLQGDRVYRHWADFRTAEGMKAFRKAEELRQSLGQEEPKLQGLRQRWTEAQGASRDKLRAEILLAEASVRRLRSELKQALRDARYCEGVR